MKSRRMFGLLAVLLMASMLVACGGQPAQPTQTPAEESQPTQAPAEGGEKPFKVGLLCSGPVHDEGWNEMAYNALKRIEEELGAEVGYVELEESPASFEKAFRDFASQGYQMILGHGFQFQDAALTVSKEYPDTYFFISSSRIYEGNVIGLNTDSSQPFYVLGVIAASMGKGAGLVGGMEIPPIIEAFNGFILGARSVNPDFPLSVTYLGNFTDTAAAKEAALSIIAEGADFVVHDADMAGLGVYQAVVESGPDICTFGVFGSATDQAPDNVVANYISDYGQGIVNIAKEVKAGTFKPTGNIEFGLKHKDVMWVEYNEQAKRPVPEDVRKLVDEVTEKIAAGEIDTLAPIE